MTAAIEMLHSQYPNKYLTAIDSPVPAIWENNPHVAPKASLSKDAKYMRMNYPAVHESGQRPIHFLQGYVEYLGDQLKIPLKLNTNRPHLYISAQERSWINQVQEVTGDSTPYWIINSGVKRDYTAKGWGQASYQKLVNECKDRIRFVQVGEAGHLHPPLEGVVDFRGRTDTRQLIRLCWNAQGGVGPSTFIQHIFAAFQKPYVCIAGGRESKSWLDYPTQVTLSSIGTMDCCQNSGCWKSRVVPLGDGKDLDSSLCANPVFGNEPVPKCLSNIHPDDVKKAIYSFYDGGILKW